MRPIAVIDVGSNSICLMTGLVLRSGRIHVIDKLKDAARMRDELGEDGTLSEAAIERAVALLKVFRTQVDEFDAELRAVATATLRAARNTPEFVERVRQEAGIELEVISGEQEARLAFRGVVEGMGAPPGDVLCADVGGGSTELVLGRDGEVAYTVSIPVGALVVAKQWLGPDPVSPQAVARARKEIDHLLRPALRNFHDLPHLRGIATSGTIQRIARIAAALDGQVRTDVDRMVLGRTEFARVVAALEHAPTQRERLHLPGMDPTRADSLLGGALIHAALADALSLHHWTVSMAGLRMGILAELRDARWPSGN